MKEKQEIVDLYDRRSKLEKENQQLKDQYEDVVQRYEFDSSLWAQKLQVCEEELQKQDLRSQELTFQVENLQRRLRDSSAAQHWFQCVQGDERLFGKVVGMNKSEFAQLYNDVKSKLSHTTHHSDERTRNSRSTYTDAEGLLITLTLSSLSRLIADFALYFAFVNEELSKCILCGEYVSNSKKVAVRYPLRLRKRNASRNGFVGDFFPFLKRLLVLLLSSNGKNKVRPWGSKLHKREYFHSIGCPVVKIPIV